MPEHRRRSSLKDTFKRAFSKQPYISDPFLPPGGLPLPAIIRRRFSFAPQLPEIARLSILQGFTASQYSLREAHHEERPPAESKITLIQMPEGSLQQVLLEKQDKQEIKHSTTTFPTSVAIINDLNRRDSSSSRHTIRKVAGQKNLRTSASQTGSSSDDDGNSSTYISRNSDTTEHSPLSDTFPKEQKIPTAEAPLPDTTPIQQRSDPLDFPILKHIKKIPNFLRSFYINDTELPGNPINLVSRDLKPPGELKDGEGLFLDSVAFQHDSSELLTNCTANGDIEYHLVFSQDLISQETGRARYQLTSQLNITRLLSSDILESFSSALDCDLPLDEDDEWESLDWFTIAEEEVAKTTGRTGTKPRQNHEPKPTTKPPGSTTPLRHTLKSLYKDYFILTPPPLSTSHGFYEIAYLSPSLFQSGEYKPCPDRGGGQLTHTPPETIGRLGRSLAEGKEVAVEVKWGVEGAGKWLFCSPLFGPGLGCWICFLIDAGVGDVWGV